MEDRHLVVEDYIPVGSGMPVSFMGVFDGHGGSEASQFIKRHMFIDMVEEVNFSLADDNRILDAMRRAAAMTNEKMKIESSKSKCGVEFCRIWKTIFNLSVGTWREMSRSGIPRAGTTATWAILICRKLFVGHIGDSAAVLGYSGGSEEDWQVERVTTKHSTDNSVEATRVFS